MFVCACARSLMSKCECVYIYIYTYIARSTTMSCIYISWCCIKHIRNWENLTFKCSWASLTVFPSFFFFQLWPSFRKFLSILRSNKTIVPPVTLHNQNRQFNNLKVKVKTKLRKKKSNNQVTPWVVTNIFGEKKMSKLDGDIWDDSWLQSQVYRFIKIALQFIDIGGYFWASSLAWHWCWSSCNYRVLHEFHLGGAILNQLLP